MPTGECPLVQATDSAVAGTRTASGRAASRFPCLGEGEPSPPFAALLLDRAGNFLANDVDDVIEHVPARVCITDEGEPR